jgi:hypothetical protein
MVLAYGFAFLFIAGCSYAASSLIGQTMLEQARREGLRASERAAMARKDVAALRQRIERLLGLRSVEKWAEVRGFRHDGEATIYAMNGAPKDEPSTR